MRVIFLAYRQWSIDVMPAILKHPRISDLVFCKTKQELLNLKLENFDLLITCGWSEELGSEIVDKIEAIGVHCAELDRYSYGSPLQNQIIDGLLISKHRVFPFTHDKELKRAHTHTREYSHEVDLDLSGNMSDVLFQMTSTSIVLFNMYLNDYPNIVWKKWPEEKLIREKRNPVDSKLTKEDFQKMTSEQLNNFLRCLEDPYPNAYLEDEQGYLYFEKVRYKKK